MKLLTFDQATEDDTEAVLSLLDQAAAWLSSKGIVQWPQRFSHTEGWRIARITRYITNGQTWLVRANGTPVATFTIGGPDPDYEDGWPDGSASGLYIFRMAVDREWAGQDIGGQILDWVSVHAAANGYSWLRLDCSRDNRQLQKYYEARGFTRVNTLIRTITESDGTPYTRKSGALYQRRAGSTYHKRQIGADKVADRYDPNGEAAIWQAASDKVASLKRGGDDSDDWNAALEQAARALESEARGIRQQNGMYYRVISGSKYDPLKSDETD